MSRDAKADAAADGAPARAPARARAHTHARRTARPLAAPLARPRARRKSAVERSAEIAAAARELALAEGLSAVTLRAIAARVAVTPALVAHYQPSMNALVADTFGDIVSREIAEIAGLATGAGSPTARLRWLVDTVLDGTRDDVTLVWVDAWSLGRRNSVLAERARSEMNAWQGVIERLVDEGIASGEFSTADAATVAWTLLGMIDGLNAHALVRWDAAGDRGSRLDRAVEALLGIVPGGLSRTDDD